MKALLNIITITKDDFEGVCATISSTRSLREHYNVQQIIIDSSSDITALEIRESISREKNIRYEWYPPLGISPAFNKGLDLADADWVWFLNGRDEVYHDLKQDMLLDILSSSFADIIIFELVYMQSKSRYVHPPIWKLWPPVQFWVPHPATIIRTEMFSKYGRFSEKYRIAMDGEIWFRFFSKGALVDMLSIPVSSYDEGGLSRIHAGHTAREGQQIIADNFFMLVRLWFLNGWSICMLWWHFYKRSRGD